MLFIIYKSSSIPMMNHTSLAMFSYAGIWDIIKLWNPMKSNYVRFITLASQAASWNGIYCRKHWENSISYWIKLTWCFQFSQCFLIVLFFCLRLSQLQNRLKEKGLSGIALKWREQSDGKVFHEEGKAI